MPAAGSFPVGLLTSGLDSASSASKAPADSQVQASQTGLIGSPLTIGVAASSAATSAGPDAAGKSAAEPKSVSAPDDGNIDAQSGSAEPDEANGPRPPVIQQGSDVVLGAGENALTGSGAEPATTALSTNSMPGSSGRPGSSADGEGSPSQVLASDRAAAQGGVRAGLLLAGSRNVAGSGAKRSGHFARPRR